MNRYQLLMLNKKTMSCIELEVDAAGISEAVTKGQHSADVQNATHNAEWELVEAWCCEREEYWSKDRGG